MKLIFKYILFCLSLFYILIPSKIYSQEDIDLKEKFLEAESYFLFEEYTEALPAYLILNENDPTNDNINYRIGVCYLNITYEKEKSIEFLEKASKNITLDYKEGSFKETRCPLEVYFFLGDAYRVNDNLDKALENYHKFMNELNEEVYNKHIVEEQILACERAKKLKESPIYYNSVNLGDIINDRYPNFNPVVSRDESMIIFSSKLPFYEAVYFSKKVEGEWTIPVNLIPYFGIDEDAFPTSISSDGKELYIYRNDEFDGNLYISRYDGDVWSPIEKLNENINTKFWESHACISPDGKTLYFTSNRKDTYGGLDIYKSERNSPSEEWGPAKNLGKVINTEYNEETPFLSEDGKTLYFSSYGHYNMGGYDIFYSTLLDNNKWAVPLNMGYPINTTSANG